MYYIYGKNQNMIYNSNYKHYIIYTLILSNSKQQFYYYSIELVQYYQ